MFASDENVAIAYGMGITAEKVAEEWKVSREDQDAFALPRTRRRSPRSRPASSPPRSRRTKSSSARPTSPTAQSMREAAHRRDRRRPAPRYLARGLAKLKPVFRASSAAASPPATARRCPTAPARCLASEQAIKDYGLTPLARFVELLGRRRAPGGDGHRPDRRDPEGAQAGRPDAGPASTGSSSTKPSPRRRWR